ncbi:MAG: hypothetical protein AAF449_10175, partial [Myxococcota bacterium]
PVPPPEKPVGRQHPKVRTEHGTRVARAITCIRCNSKDILHFIPRHGANALCRKCAAETLEIADVDAGILPASLRGPEDDRSSPPPSNRRRTTKGVIRVRRKDEA